MAFKVECNQPEPSHTFDDDDKFEFMDGGVLKVGRSNTTNLYFSPAVWRTQPRDSAAFYRLKVVGPRVYALGPFLSELRRARRRVAVTARSRPTAVL
jgi:hypothetical protein